MPDKTPAEIKAEKREREDYATTRTREREDKLASIKRPARGTKELSETRKAAKGMQGLLSLYDSMETAPVIADSAHAIFEELVARVQELSTPAPKSE